MSHPSFKTELFVCECGTAQHQFIVTYDTEDDEVYVQIKMNPVQSWWNRLKHALKYLFKHEDTYQYEEVILSHPDRQKLAKMLLSKPKPKKKKEPKNVRATDPR